MDNQQQQQQQQLQPQEMQMDSNIVKLRGLPWNVTPKEILQFLEGVQVDKGENGVHLITSPRDGRPNGEAFVECANEGDVAKAFEFQNKTLGHRYIEIFNAQVDEFESVLNKQHVVQMDTFIKLRGLPYSITPEEIEQFFDGLQLNKDQDVHIVMDNRGRASGEAFVRFGNLDDTEKALKRNREKIGHRYIEIFRSTNSEFRRNMYGSNRPGPYDRGNNGGMGNGGGGAGGMGMGGGGPIRNNFNGPRGRMMRGGGSEYDGGNNGPWKSRPSYDNFYEDDNSYNNGGCQNNAYNNNNVGTGMGGFNAGNGNGSGYRANNDYSNNFAMTGNRFNSGGGAGIGGSAFSTSSSMGVGASGNGGMNSVGMGFGAGGYNGNGAFGGAATGMGAALTSGPMGGNGGAGMANNGALGGGYRSNNGNGFNDYSQTNQYGNGGNTMGNGGGGAWRDNSGGDIGGSGGMTDTFCVHMRGMPYYCDEQDIYKFFAPLKPINCQVIYNNRGLHSGEADAVFANQADAMQAMGKNKEKMGTRYIELFYKNGNQNNMNNGGGGVGVNNNNNMNRRRY